MSGLPQALMDYLRLRRSLGYQLRRPEKLLQQFLDYLEAAGAETITTEHALAWACQPKEVNSGWRSQRLRVVRGFAKHLQNLDIHAEVPPRDLLPWRAQCASPYLYTEQEIVALIEAAKTLSSPLRVTTYQTLIGLLAVTGMRVGEAINLDRDDFDARHGLLVIRHAKLNKTRELPLHATTVAALRCYLGRRDRQRLQAKSPAIFAAENATVRSAV